MMTGCVVSSACPVPPAAHPAAVRGPVLRAAVARRGRACGAVRPAVARLGEVRRVRRLRLGRHRPHRRPRHLARPRGPDRRPRLPAGRPLEQHRGRSRVLGPLGDLARGPQGPPVRPQRPSPGTQWGPPLGRDGPRRTPQRREGHVRRALPRPRAAPRESRPERHRPRPRLGDERHHVHAPLRSWPGGVEAVLGADRERDAEGSRPAVPFRVHPQQGPGRDPLAPLLSRGPARRHHRHGRLWLPARHVLHVPAERAVRPQGTRPLRPRPPQADRVPGVGPVRQRRQPRLRTGDV